MSAAPPATLFEKIDAFRVLAQTILVALTHFVTAPVRSGPRPKALYKDVMFRALRYNLGSLNVSQEKYMNPSTEANYLSLVKEESLQPDSIALNSGCRAFWFGSKRSEKVILYLHGGGYVMPCSPGHMKWLSELSRDLSKSYSISIVLLAYTCSPEAQYPTQLSQAAELLHHLLTVEGRKPSDLILAGDSAGGNLSVGLLSHILHPHPSISTKIDLSEPLRAAVLISPWVNFDTNQPCFDRNVQTDMISKEVGARWSGAFLGTADLDNYNQPILADDDWFADLENVVGDILVWGGGGEVLIDSIRDFTNKLKKAMPKTELVVEPGVGHEDFIIEKLIGYKTKAQGTEVIEQWISSKL